MRVRVLNVTDDPRAKVANPGLTGRLETAVAPCGATERRFADGSKTIAEVRRHLVETYATPESSAFGVIDCATWRKCRARTFSAGHACASRMWVRWRCRWILERAPLAVGLSYGKASAGYGRGRVRVPNLSRL